MNFLNEFQYRIYNIVYNPTKYRWNIFFLIIAAFLISLDGFYFVVGLTTFIIELWQLWDESENP